MILLYVPLPFTYRQLMNVFEFILGEEGGVTGGSSNKKVKVQVLGTYLLDLEPLLEPGVEW